MRHRNRFALNELTLDVLFPMLDELTVPSKPDTIEQAINKAHLRRKKYKIFKTGHDHGKNLDVVCLLLNPDDFWLMNQYFKKGGTAIEGIYWVEWLRKSASDILIVQAVTEEDTICGQHCHILTSIADKDPIRHATLQETHAIMESLYRRYSLLITDMYNNRMKSLRK